LPFIGQNSFYAFIGVLVLPHWFICYFQGYGRLFSNLIFIFNIKFKKSIDPRCSCARALVPFVFFQRRVWHHYLSENDLPSCHWKRLYVLFLLVWRMSVVNRWLVTSCRFFFFFPTFLSLPVKVHVCPLFLLFSISVLMFFIFYFHHWPVDKSFLYFQSSP